MSAERRKKTAVIGGGITGLFCAYVLAQHEHDVQVFEATNRWGGRILTVPLHEDALKTVADRATRADDGDVDDDPAIGSDDSSTPVADATDVKVDVSTSSTATADSTASSPAQPDKSATNFSDLAFWAEFGPMRVELDKQVLLKSLLTHLGIERGPDNDKDRSEACLIPFPSYGSPGDSHDPAYDLRPDEIGKTPIQLLSLALLRIMLRLRIEPDDEKVSTVNVAELDEKDQPFSVVQTKLIHEVSIAAATGEDVLAVFTRWLEESVTDIHYYLIQTKGKLGTTPLAAFGFWNLLSDHLSHDAIAKIRDLGTFYHLLPENPNAAEWLVWWLIGFAIGNKLQGVFGGMSHIIDKLMQKLKKELKEEGHLHLEHKLEIVAPENGTLTLTFKGGKKIEGFDHVILALPKASLVKLVQQNHSVFVDAEPRIDELLGSAIAFPMVKVFVAVRNRWWGNERMANRYATRIPTREVHYWPARNGGPQGLIMLYTDRPASSYWANYLKTGEQTDVARSDAISDEQRLPPNKTDRLLRKIIQYLNENNVPNLNRDDIVWWGIRDWGREPFGGANHVWRPERKYWVVMALLADMTEPKTKARMHICGEAYSDYHGFIEGSLRSAVYTLHRILGKDENGAFDVSTSWLGKSGIKMTCKKDKRYLRALRIWANELDAIKPDAEFLIED
jgi:hypothetical protein